MVLYYCFQLNYALLMGDSDNDKEDLSAPEEDDTERSKEEKGVGKAEDDVIFF